MNDDGNISRILRDAGCPPDQCFSFLQCSRTEQMQMLEAYRKKLLLQMHAVQQRLDCLDYLRYQYQREDRERDKER